MTSPPAHSLTNTLQSAVRHHQEGRLAEAEQLYKQVLKAQPENSDALHLLGVIAHQRGQYETAVKTIQQAIALRPDAAEYHNNCGEAFRAMGRLEAAVECYQKAVALNPGFALAHNNLGMTYQALGKLDRARQCYEKTIAAESGQPEAYYNLGLVLQAQGRLEVATKCFQAAIRLKPDWADAYHKLGNACWKGKKPEDARANYLKALQLKPYCGEYYGSLANLLLGMGDLDAAESIRQDVLLHLNNISSPHYSKDLGSLIFLFPYLSLDGKPLDVLMEACDRKYRKDLKLYSPANVKKTRRLRIGYVSPDFGDHPVGHVMRGLFREHDRNDFEIFVYSLKDRSRESSGHCQYIRENCDRFIDLSSLTPLEAAKHIASDGVSILINLSGYMSRESLDIFSYRVAPLQLYWLGHGGGLGLSFIDYVIADAVVIPFGEEHRYKEKILRLPEVYHSTDTPPIADHEMQRVDHGLAENAFVYCVFNTPKKIDKRVFDAWMNILRHVPGSQLWLSRLKEPDLLVNNLRQEAEKRGINSRRLVFAPRIENKSDHLARHRLADLFLDTFTYNASTTAIDALWAGLPILTCPGSTFYSRICSSLLRSVGLADMICDSVQTYEDRAVYLATERNALAEVRERLARNRMSHPLFDIKRFVRHLEAGYREIWERSQENRPHQHVNISPFS